jgi:uncharacterized protein (TIGR00251 family)
MTDARITVRLQPRASKDELLDVRDGVLRARVRAPAAGGRANRALCRLIAQDAGVAPSRVTIVHGVRSREKVVRVEGLDQTALHEAIYAAPVRVRWGGVSGWRSIRTIATVARTSRVKAISCACAGSGRGRGSP